MGSTPSIFILLVDGNEDDVALMRKVLDRGRLYKGLHVVDSGEEALQFLRREPPYEDAPRPKLVILDLHLPKMSGLDVLRQMKEDRALRPIPVIILTASYVDEDLLAAYDERARAFISKPVDRDAFERVIERIEAFWLRTAKLPVD